MLASTFPNNERRIQLTANQVKMDEEGIFTLLVTLLESLFDLCIILTHTLSLSLSHTHTSIMVAIMLHLL